MTQPDPQPLHPVLACRDTFESVWRGFKGCCPKCGEGRLLHSYLKVVDTCPKCGEAMHHHRADDAPAYFTMLIVAHVTVGGLMAIEQRYAPPTWVQLSIWLPLTAIMCLVLLPRIKGALVGLQWALRMHGFGSKKDPALPEPLPPSIDHGPTPAKGAP